MACRSSSFPFLSLPFPSVRSSRSAALALAASLGIAALAPTVAHADTEAPAAMPEADTDDTEAQRSTTWSRSAKRSFFDLYDRDKIYYYRQATISNPEDMKLYIRELYSDLYSDLDLSKRKVNRVYRDYILGVLNGKIRYSYKDFVIHVHTTSRIPDDNDKFMGGKGSFYKQSYGPPLSTGEWVTQCKGCRYDGTQWVTTPGYWHNNPDHPWGFHHGGGSWHQQYRGLGSQFELTLDEQNNVNYSFAAHTGLEDVKIKHTKLDLGFGEDWDVHNLRYNIAGKPDSTIIYYSSGQDRKESSGHDHILEVWTDRASSDENDYMMGGFWLKHTSYRDQTSTNLRHFYFLRDKGPKHPRPFIGKATYKGIALGYLLKDVLGKEYTDERQRLTGSVKLEADFKDAEKFGSISGQINKLHLDGDAVDGAFKLNSSGPDIDEGTVEANVNGIPLGGKWGVRFSSVEENQPSKLAGWAAVDTDGEGRYEDETAPSYYEQATYTYRLIFGAKKVDEP